MTILDDTYEALAANIDQFDEAAYLVIADYCEERNQDGLGRAWRKMAADKTFPAGGWAGGSYEYHWYARSEENLVGCLGRWLPENLMDLVPATGASYWHRTYRSAGEALQQLALAMSKLETGNA